MDEAVLAERRAKRREYMKNYRKQPGEREKHRQREAARYKNKKEDPEFRARKNALENAR